MGFYIQDDYYSAAIESLAKREQEQFWAVIIRYYFDPEFEAENERMPKAVRGMFATVRVRIDRARRDAERKRTIRGQSTDTPRTFCAAPIQSEKEKKKERKKEKTAPPASSPCPKCGEARGAIVAGMYRCDECDITWKGAAS